MGTDNYLIIYIHQDPRTQEFVCDAKLSNPRKNSWRLRRFKAKGKCAKYTKHLTLTFLKLEEGVK